MNKSHRKNVEKDILNVVEDFDCSTQNEAYNQKFKEWRRRKDNPCAFSFEVNKKERVFNDSRGFEERSPETEEKRAISSIMYVIGVAMLIVIVMDTFVIRILAAIFSFFGLKVTVPV